MSAVANYALRAPLQTTLYELTRGKAKSKAQVARGWEEVLDSY
jgi:hypothetical protein